MIEKLSVGDQFVVTEDCEHNGAYFFSGTVYTVVSTKEGCDWYAVTPGRGAENRWYFGLDPWIGDLSSKIRLVDSSELEKLALKLLNANLEMFGRGGYDSWSEADLSENTKEHWVGLAREAKEFFEGKG